MKKFWPFKSKKVEKHSRKKANDRTPGVKWELSPVFEEAIEAYAKTDLKKQKYQATDSLDEIGRGVSRPYRGGKYDPEKFEVVKGGWRHDHCEFCWWTIFESENEEEGMGYTDGEGHWICLDCYAKLLKPKIEQVASRNPDKSGP